MIGTGSLCQAGGDFGYTFYVPDPTGFVHTWPNFGIDTNGCVYPVSGSAVDAYGYAITAYFSGTQPYASVTDPNGTVLVHSALVGFGGGTPTDSNGNEFTSTPSNTILDYTGNVVLTNTATGFSYNNQALNPVSVSITSTSYTLATDFQCPGIGEWGSFAARPLPTKITMPDHSRPN